MVNASNPVAPGGTQSYTMVFGNPGGVSAPAAVLSVPLPAGTTFVSASDGGAVSGGIVSWNVGALPAGGTGQRTLTVQLDPQAASGSIVAATANLSDAATGRSLARGSAAAAVLSSSATTQVAIAAAPDAVRPGQVVQYAVTVTNRDTLARGYVITAQVPSGTTVASSAISTVPNGYNAGCGNTTICTAGATIAWGSSSYGTVSLAPGQSMTVSFSALVDATNPPPNGTVIRSTATANGFNNNGTSGASASVDVVIQGGASSAPPVLSTDLASLSFGTVQVGHSKDLTLTVTNTGAGTLTGTATPSASFSVVSGSPFSLTAGQSQIVTVRFAPSTAVVVSGQLSVTSNGGSATVQLSGTGTPLPAPILTLSTNVLVFPGTIINSNSLPAVITITNTGGANLILGAASLGGANPGDFVIAGNSCSGATLPPNPAPSSSCTLSISFGPTALGARMASISIPSNAAGGPASVSMSGTGLAAPAPAVTLSPTGLTFASTTIGANSLPQSVVLTNSGTANLLLGPLSLGGANPSDYLVVTNTCSNATLIPNGTCTFSVSFQPTATGTRTASATISSNATGSPHSVSLTGTGAAQAAPAVTLSANSLPFNSQTIGTTSAALPVVLTNSGTANLVLGTLTLAGANPGDYVVGPNNCNNATLIPNGTCSFSVSFKPTATGTRTASVSIPSNAAGSPSTVTLSGTGVATPTPAVTLSTSSLPFNSQTIGTTSAALPVVLTNSGTANLVLGTLTLAGTNPGDYVVASNNCNNATVIPNGTCSFSVSFRPTSTGTRTASVSIPSNAAGSPSSVSLTGTGAAPTAPAVTLSTSALTFGSQTTNTTSSAQSVVLTNSGTGSLVLGALTLGGANQGEYVVGPNNCNNATLSPSGTCSFSVSFRPTAIGIRTASVSIPSNAAGSPSSVSLIGTSIGPLAPGPCTVSANPSSPLPFGGGQVTLTASCSTTGGTPTSYSWTGSFLNGPITSTTNSATGNVAQTTTFSVVAHNSAGNSSQANISVAVDSSQPKILMSQYSLDFGIISPGAIKDLTLTIKNVGTGTLIGAISAPSPFSIRSGANYSLTSGSSALIIVRLQSNLDGLFTGQLITTGNATAALVSVTGVVAVPPRAAPKINDITPSASIGRTVYATGTNFGTDKGSITVGGIPVSSISTLD